MVDTTGQRIGAGTGPSQTALTAAAARAAHLIVDAPPPIFADTLAYRLLGERAEELVAYHRQYGDHPILVGARSMATARGRYTEGHLAAAVGRGIDQYVILGAGLDSYAYRADPDAHVRVFEVDRPATQEWKRRALDNAGIAVGGVDFVAVDFESDSLTGRLVDAGFDPGRPAFVSWLGVIMYLSRPAVERTLAVLAGLAAGSEIVAEYLLPEDLRDDDGRMYAAGVGAVAAEHGEPWRTSLAPEQMTGLLAAHGFDALAQVPHRDMVDAALWRRSDPLRPYRLAMLAHARRRPGGVPGS